MALVEEVAASRAPVQERLQSLVDWERVPRGAMRVDLAPQRDLLARLGQPHRQFRSVHVTGTKGKGSVCALIEAALLHAGWRAGRYASPHVEHITERICHGGQPLGSASFDTAVERALDARDAGLREGTDAARATWFDVLTAAAFWSFAEARLDWAVVEVGMGGMLDSTNVLEPDLAIITNVALEHVEVLGPTIERITWHKAGIIKPGRPVLTPLDGTAPAGRIIAERASAVGAPLEVLAGVQASAFVDQNRALARRALDLLGRQGHVSPARQAMLAAADLPDLVAERVRLPGRLEHRGLVTDERGHWTPVVLDGAHVGFALDAVLHELAWMSARDGLPVVLLALARDKPAADFVSRMAGRVHLVVCCELMDARGCWRASELAEQATQAGLRAVACADPVSALALAGNLAAGGNWVLVTGSLHLVGSLRSLTCGTEAGWLTAGVDGVGARPSSFRDRCDVPE